MFESLCEFLYYIFNFLYEFKIIKLRIILKIIINNILKIFEKLFVKNMVDKHMEEFENLNEQ